MDRRGGGYGDGIPAQFAWGAGGPPAQYGGGGGGEGGTHGWGGGGEWGWAGGGNDMGVGGPPMGALGQV